MKEKLKIAFILIALALVGIIVFQIYWSVNVYRVNKEKFDANINVAMQRAIDDCKKDYFDSIRRVLVKRLSPPETTIKIDTAREKDTANALVLIHLSNKYTATTCNTTISRMNFYRKKLYHKASIQEVITEMSFYEPQLMNSLTVLLGMYDLQDHSVQLATFVKKHPDAPIDTMLKFNRSIPHSIYELPDNPRNAASLKLRRYFTGELRRMGIYSPFNIVVATGEVPFQRSNLHYSETNAFAYKYQGFTQFHIVGPVFYVHATFRQPQYAIFKRMLTPLIMSILLVLFVIFCFYYVVHTIMAQKKLADLKDDFINNMTHELKTPIATIAVAIEGLQKFNALNDKEKTQRYLDTSKNELARLNTLVTKVLDIAAFENKEIELSKEKVNINELINEVIDSERQKTDKIVHITFENQSGEEFIPADKMHLRNVLANLVDNAIKYSKQPVDIAINCYKNDGELAISVKDNGMGIPAAHLGLIFDKFHRVPTGNVHSVKGTGLGLSYVKYIVEAHGGEIVVKSEVNKGTEFIVSLPLKDE